MLANGCPIFFTDVIVDGDGAVAVEAVGTVFFGAGDPEVFTGLLIDVVVFVAVADFLELAALVIQGATRLGEGDATDDGGALNAGGALKLAGFIFDIHDAGSGHGGIV